MMANLQIKGIDDDLYKEIKHMAASRNRSVSQQVLMLIKNYLSKQHQIEKIISPAQVLIDLSGSWDDTRSAEDIIMDIKSNRKNSKKLEMGL
jgi:hypothetical protein